jgi:hypothetical protein
MKLQMKYWIAAAACACSLACALSIAQAPDEAAKRARLDQVASSYTKDNAFMGAVLVVDGDTVLLDKAYSMADLEWSIPKRCFRPIR